MTYFKTLPEMSPSLEAYLLLRINIFCLILSDEIDLKVNESDWMLFEDLFFSLLNFWVRRFFKFSCSVILVKY